MFEIKNRDIVGFTYEGENLCHVCGDSLAERVVYENAWLEPGRESELSGSELMELWASKEDIDISRNDRFDSGEFPKPFEDADTDERCAHCDGVIADVYHHYYKDYS